MADKIKSRFIRFGTGPDDTNARLIPANFTPNKYVASAAAGEGDDKISAHLKGIDDALSLVTPQNIVWVKKNPGVGEFNSIKDAIASISGESASNPYLVMVGPGVYVEEEITMRPYISVSGVDQSVVIVVASDPGDHVFIGDHSCSLSNVYIEGSTDTDVSAVYYKGTSGTYSPFRLTDCTFGTNDVLVDVEGGINPTIFRADRIRIDSTKDFRIGFRATNAAAGPVQMTLFNVISQDLEGPNFPERYIYGTGAGVNIILKDISFRSSGNQGHAIHVQDGVKLQILDCYVEGFEVGLHSANIGAPCVIETLSLTCLRNDLYDIFIEHPGTTGSIAGAAEASKVFIDVAGPAMTINLIDPIAGGLSIAGGLYFGRHTEDLTEIGDLIEAGTMGVIEGGELSDGGGFQVNVSEGFGYCVEDPFPDHKLRKQIWSNTSITLSANQDVYIYFNQSGILSSSANYPFTHGNIVLGRVVTDGTGIKFIDQSPMNMHYYGNQVDRMLRMALGPIYASGTIVSENVSDRKLDVTSGEYFFSGNRFLPNGGTAIEFDQYYRDGMSGWNISLQDTVNNTHYDDGSGTLVALTAGYYAKHSLFLVGTGANTKYFLVIGQQEFDSEGAAVAGADAAPPSFFRDAVVHVASIVVQEGVSNIVEIIDTKPTLSFRAGSVSSVSNHGNLSGLGNDDHPQYLLVSGTRAMSGNLDMGGNSITNVNLVDGVDVSAHAARHLPNGSDPIASAAGITISATTSNAIGTANSFARSDHGHAVLTGVVSTQLPAQANAAGTSANLARADHIHNIPVATPVSVGSANAEGSAASFSRSDHVHAHGDQAGGTLHAVATGSVAGFMSSADKTKLDGISGTRRVKSGVISAGSFTGNPKVATVTFSSAFADTNYSFVIMSADQRMATYENKTAGSIVVNLNANQAPTGDVMWIALDHGETIE